MTYKKRILVAALNWGLGHAARSVPVIKELLHQGAEVIIGSDSEALKFLSDEFPELETIELPPYHVSYKYSNMFLNIAPQLPKLLTVLNKERLFLDDIIRLKKIDAVISDNRYGMFSNKIPTVLITHQLNIKIPNFITSAIINRLNRSYLKKYRYVWIPDYPGTPNLSGELGHGLDMKHLRYLGPLSRLDHNASQDNRYDIVAVLSGPEPQRSYLEDKITEQLKNLELSSLIVRGKPGKNIQVSSGNYPHVIDFADSNRIASFFKGAKMLIVRSGYSTLMDIAKTGTNSVLFIPTPGQTEQEFLAVKMETEGAVMMQQQHKIDILKAWNHRKSFQSVFQNFDNVGLQNSISELLNCNSR